MGAEQSSAKSDLVLRGVWKAVGTESNLKEQSWVSPTYLFDFDQHDPAAPAASAARTFAVWEAARPAAVSYGRVLRRGRDLGRTGDGAAEAAGDAADAEERRVHAVLAWSFVTAKNKRYHYRAAATAEYRPDTAVLRGVYGPRPDCSGPPPLAGNCTYDFWRVSPLSDAELAERRQRLQEQQQQEQQEQDQEDSKKKKEEDKGRIPLGKRLGTACEVLLATVGVRVCALAAYFAALNWDRVVRTRALPPWDLLVRQARVYCGVPLVLVAHLASGWVCALHEALTALLVRRRSAAAAAAPEPDEPWWRDAARALCAVLGAAAHAAVGWALGDAVAAGGADVAALLRGRAGLPPVAAALAGAAVACDLLRAAAFGARVRHNGAWGVRGVCAVARLAEPAAAAASAVLFAGAAAAALARTGTDLVHTPACLAAVVAVAAHVAADLVAAVARDTALVETSPAYVRYAAHTRKLFFLFV